MRWSAPATVDPDEGSDDRNDGNDDRKIDAFRLTFGAVTLPFGGVLGALLGNVGRDLAGGAEDIGTAAAFRLTLALIALFLFFVQVPMICEGIIHRRFPGRPLIALTIGAVVWCMVIMPSGEFGVPYRLWLAATGAWLICCLILCALCRHANIEKSIFR